MAAILAKLCTEGGAAPQIVTARLQAERTKGAEQGLAGGDHTRDEGLPAEAERVAYAFQHVADGLAQFRGGTGHVLDGGEGPVTHGPLRQQKRQSGDTFIRRCDDQSGLSLDQPPPL